LFTQFDRFVWDENPGRSFRPGMIVIQQKDGPENLREIPEKACILQISGVLQHFVPSAASWRHSLRLNLNWALAGQAPLPKAASAPELFPIGPAL